MTSAKQIDANRRNARKSTGPRTPAGKAAVHLNAFKHRIFAESRAISGENTDAFAALKRAFFCRFQPASPDKQFLVAAIAHNASLLERFSHIETHVWNHDLSRIPGDHTHPLAVAHPAIYRTFSHLQRRIDSAACAHRRDLEGLPKLQSARHKPVPAPEPISQPQSPQPLTPEIGLVPANSRPDPPSQPPGPRIRPAANPAPPRPSPIVRMSLIG